MRYAILCQFWLCCSLPCFALPACYSLHCLDMLCYASFHFAMPCFAMLSFSLLSYAVLFFAFLSFATFWLALLRSTMVLLYMLCCGMPCYALLCSVMHCYALYTCFCYDLQWQLFALLALALRCFHIVTLCSAVLCFAFCVLGFFTVFLPTYWESGGRSKNKFSLGEPVGGASGNRGSPP